MKKVQNEFFSLFRAIITLEPIHASADNVDIIGRARVVDGATLEINNRSCSPRRQ